VKYDPRPSAIAGTWYEGEAKALAANIDQYLKDVQLSLPAGEVMGVIAPHAGHRYSGHVAAHGFAALRGLSPELVVLVGPYHDFASHPLLVTAHDAYSTPLGDIAVDKAALSQLQKQLDITLTPISRDREHSLEIELPFLQRMFDKAFKLLPIMIRAQEPEVARKLGQALARVVQGGRVLLVASTDLSHFHDHDTARMLDREMLQRFEAMDPDSIFEAERSGKGFACGHAAVASVLWACLGLGGNMVKVVNHATSGDVTGDRSSVVGYGAAVILKTI
jgi:AmmeMemoRadiSam system protein B